jgi:hypothetical protein
MVVAYHPGALLAKIEDLLSMHFDETSTGALPAVKKGA